MLQKNGRSVAKVLKSRRSQQDVSTGDYLVRFPVAPMEIPSAAGLHEDAGHPGDE